MAFTGVNTTESISDQTAALEEYATALRERQGSLGGSPTSFTDTSDGRICANAGAIGYEYVSKLQAGIQGLLATPRLPDLGFVQADGTPWANLAAMLTDADGSSAWDTDYAVENGNIWDQIQACLELLVHYVVSKPLTDRVLTRRTSDASLYVPQDLWDDMLANADEEINGGLVKVYWSVFTTEPIAGALKKVEFTVDLTSQLGEIEKVVCTVSANNPADADATLPVETSWGASFTAQIGDVEEEYSSEDVPAWTMGAENTGEYLQIAGALPATVPLESGLASVEIASVVLYADISSGVTYG